MVTMMLIMILTGDFLGVYSSDRSTKHFTINSVVQNQEKRYINVALSLSLSLSLSCLSVSVSLSVCVYVMMMMMIYIYMQILYWYDLMP